MVTTQNVIDRLQELSKDKNLLKEFNKQYFTDITDIFFNIGTDYTCVIVYTKHFTFNIELFDYEDKCNYSMELMETAWHYDFDDCIDEENIRFMYTNKGEFSESDSVENLGMLLSEILPSKEEEKELENRIKNLLKFKKTMSDIVDEYEGNQYIVVDFVKHYCDCF